MTGNVRTLSEQLTAAMADAASGEGELFEVAVLAGLLSRYADAPAGLIEQARAAIRKPRKAEADPLLEDAMLDELTARFCGIDEQDDEAELQELLLDLDEICAGVWFLGEAERYRSVVEESAACVRAFPSLWRALSPWASRLLGEAPPRTGDPALVIWRAVESSLFEDEVVAPPLCIDATASLGLLSRVSVSGLRQAAPAQFYAATELKPPPALHALVQAGDVEVSAALDPQQGPILLIRCPSAPALRRAGNEVRLAPLAPTLFSSPAEPGRYVLAVGEATYVFEVTD